MNKLVTLTREELYRMVWSGPLNGVAKRYSLTGYALRLICIRLSIPVPRRQHLKQIKAGLMNDIPSLPQKYKGEQNIQLTLQRQSGVIEKKKRSQDDKEDPLVVVARRNLLGIDKRRRHNGLAWTDVTYMSIGVAPENIHRACKFMNQMIVTLQGRGHLLYLRDQRTWVKIGEQPLPIVLREKTRRVYEPKGEFSFRNSEMVPSGVLLLQMKYQFKEREWDIGEGLIHEEADRIIDNLEAASRRMTADSRKRKSFFSSRNTLRWMAR